MATDLTPAPNPGLLQRAGRAWARQAGGVQVDLALVGAGGAGLSVLTHLDRQVAALGSPPPTIALVDPVHRRGHDRTWCLWDDGTSDLDPVVHRAWSRVELVDTLGRSRVLDLGGLRYLMIRSGDFYAAADDAAARLGAVRIPVAADTVGDGWVTAPGVQLRASLVLDSRPGPWLRPPTVSWKQHFRGWTIRVPQDTFDPDLPILMDFSVPQPRHGVAFGYVLPSHGRRALVEYTQFSPTPLTEEEYARALQAYLHRRFGVPPNGYLIDHRESGVIPMDNAVAVARIGPKAFRIGAAGGATRACSGYAFAAIQRQSRAVSAAFLAGREPAPPPAYPARHRWMDTVLLQALDRRLVTGPELFVRLFERNPPERVLRFLDGGTSLGEDLALMASTPVPAMLRAVGADARTRVRRRSTR